MNQSIKQWLAAVPWETVCTVNQALCQAKQTPSEPSKTYNRARQIWERAIPCTFTLAEVLDVCRECSVLTPFVFNNGNTFAAISGTLVDPTLKTMPPVEAQIIRTTVAHYVNGLVSRKELLQVLRHFDAAWQKAEKTREFVTASTAPAETRAAV